MKYDKETGRSKQGKKEPVGELDVAEPDHYKILGISPNVAKKEIRRAYNRLALRFNPESTSAASEEMNEMFGRLKTAYDTLWDEVSSELNMLVLYYQSNVDMLCIGYSHGL